MYKLLLCWRYLLTRYLALACIVSVMLGVATLIVVNSVMGGFSVKLKDRLHGLLSDIIIESRTIDGFYGSEAKMREIRESPIGDKIQAMTSTVEVFAMLQFRVRGELITRPVRLLGVDPVGRASIGGFSEFLDNQKGSPKPTFNLPANKVEQFLARQQPLVMPPESYDPSLPPPPSPPESTFKIPRGAIIGYAIANFRAKSANPKEPAHDIRMIDVGDDVIITTVSAGKLAPVFDRFVVTDYFHSEMSEYDSNYIFVPLDYLQHLRAMDDRVTSIQIKLKNEADEKVVLAELHHIFEGWPVQVETWWEKQGPLLGAIAVEKGLLNVLLFMIICVAGFGILAIFAMIVVEKTRDIGILKALGASNRGVMAIFLGYGLLLGVIGCLLGTVIGVTFTLKINVIEEFLTKVTGQQIFPRDIYYFSEIPTDISVPAIVLVNLGAVLVAVLASVLPAIRAAMLHPVKALRYE